MLDSLTISDEQARHNRVIQQGLKLRGEWETGRLFVQGEELIPDDWEAREKPWGQLRDPTPKWRWGDATESNRAAARAVLSWFLEQREVETYLEDFEDVVARLPQEDFEQTIDFERWRNKLFSRRSWGRTAQPTGDHFAEMGGQDYEHSPDGDSG